ncbi:hypothetical protein GOP47_0010732 [Adiantum capillus-veneris]|uniref:Pectinesterase n=1 Tax=Adiantum capillus-veneris TaxID=13818 RepID=A0A9D4ZJ05_ADICA|nr:hypothetical protein GOP47_0010732 [Adiantum capillus-veneris]
MMMRLGVKMMVLQWAGYCWAACLAKGEEANYRDGGGGSQLIIFQYDQTMRLLGRSGEYSNSSKTKEMKGAMSFGRYWSRHWGPQFNDTDIFKGGGQVEESLISTWPQVMVSETRPRDDVRDRSRRTLRPYWSSSWEQHRRLVGDVQGNYMQNMNTSSSGEGRRGRGLLGRIYEGLFAMTHAQLHPAHHRPVRVLVVDQSGHGHSRSVQGAIDQVRLDNKFRIQIIIHPGIYREKVYVPYRKPFITFQGSGRQNTVITWNSRAGDKNQGGEILGTFGSASVAIDSDYFVARDITFQNTSPPPLPGAQGMQAVALRISGDKAAFIDCRMLGAQDTLFDHVGRHFFLRCYIEGAIDFIFGDGRSLYLDCELHANAVTYGAVAASQRNSANDNTGFSFVQCKITGTGLLYLGRAWGQYARILFAYCYFENIIIPDGWYDWGDTTRRETVFFGEYKCWGPGAQPRWRVSWSRKLSFQEARPFLSLGFINGHKWFNILA